MTENMAEFLLEEIIVTLEKETNNNHLPENIQYKFLENCINITVDEYGKKSIMVLNEQPISIKFENISIDIKQAIEIIAEIALTSAIPVNHLDAVKMILLIVLKTWQLSTKSISRQMADTVLILHNLNAYQHEISIEYLKSYIKQNSFLTDVEHLQNIEFILNDLYNYKIVDINNGKITLKEKVVYSK